MHSEAPPPSPSSPDDQVPAGLFADYFWFVIKNVAGWLLIVLAWPIGIFVPGPGGIPLFLIGFALITFPGKRSLTARVLRGRKMDLRRHRFTLITAAFAAVLPASAFWLLHARGYSGALALENHPGLLVAAYAAGFLVAWLLARLLLRLGNLALKYTPAIRRRVRPWMRRHGIDLLPPRRRKRLGHYPGVRSGAPDEEIIEFHERHRRRMKQLWQFSKPWMRRAAGIAFAVFIFAWLFRRVAQHWLEIRGQVQQISVGEVVLASVMFAVFLFGFRMFTWWRIMAGLGHPLPLAPALRIWSTSEMARYVGSGLSQMIGRVYLCKPYGVDSGTTSASQLLELVIFLLANILVGVGCMIWLGVKIEGRALRWFYAAIAFIPLLIATLHPRVFYGLLNTVLRRMKKAEVSRQLPVSHVVLLLLWNVVGLFFQGWAIWLVTHRSLMLKPQHWWVVTGAYCLAWMAGFIAVWASAGIGVREPVFVVAAGIALPVSVRQSLGNPKGLLMFLSILLRLWATVGELMLALVAYFLDYRGAIGRPDAPGRRSDEARTAAAETTSPSMPPAATTRPASPS